MIDSTIGGGGEPPRIHEMSGLESRDLEGLSTTEREVLAKLLQRAYRTGNPATGFDQNEKPAATCPALARERNKSTVQYLNDDELAALFRAIATEGDVDGSRADPVRDLALFEVAYHRGTRASEIGMLQIAQLRLDAKRLYVGRLKGGHGGEFLLTEREVRALKLYLRNRGTAPGPLFLSRNGKAISRRRLDELMKYYGRRAGLPLQKQHFHCLRHSCATALLDRDVDITEVQDHLGHTDIRNTMIYAKVTNRKRRAKDERLQGTW